MNQYEAMDSHGSYAWNQFYTLHKGSMYRDRHWLWAIFPELFPLPPHYKGESLTKIFVCHCGETTKLSSTFVNIITTDNISLKSCRCSKCEYNPVYRSTYIYRPGQPTRGVEVAFPSREGDILVLDIGCGTGSLAFPLMEKNAYVRVLALDYSQEAVNILRSRPRYNEDNLMGITCDITLPAEYFRAYIQAAAPSFFTKGFIFSYATLVFVLSALKDEADVRAAISNALSTLDENGVLLIYDYAVGDYREGKLSSRPLHINGSSNSKSHEDIGSLGVTYLRGEGTRAFFFNLLALKNLCAELGSVQEALVHTKEEYNKKTKEQWTKKYLILKVRK